jgi:predicted nucleotidyltransferase
MKDTISSTTNDSSLQEVIAQISKNESVLGIMQIGSLKRKQISPHSDYDLIFILEGAAKSWHSGVTYLENRLTDLMFVNSTEIQRILDLDAPVTQDNDLVPILRWLRDGEILYSVSSSIRQAQEKVSTQNWIAPIDDEAAYNAWYRINFNLAHLKRMMSSIDPLYRQTADIRMAVYGHPDIWFGYFTIRRIEFLGDKAAIRYGVFVSLSAVHQESQRCR